MVGSRTPRLLHFGLKAVLVAFVYFGLAQLSRLLVLSPLEAAAVWPASGFALAALLLLGPSYWPGILLGCTLAHLISPQSQGGWLALAQALCLGANVSFAYSMGALVLRRQGFSLELNRIRDIISLVCVSILCSLLSAAGGMAIFLSFQPESPMELLQYAGDWWAGELIGTMTVAPLIFGWATAFSSMQGPWMPRLRAFASWRAVEAVSLATALVIVSMLTFSMWDLGYFLVFPVLIWAALRYGQRGASLAMIGAMGIGIWCASEVLEHLPEELAFSLLLRFRIFLAVASATVMLLASSIQERRRAGQERLALAKEQVLHAEAESAQKRSAFLAEASSLLASSLDYRVTLQKVANLAVPRLGDFCVITSYDEHDRLSAKGTACISPEKEELLRGANRADINITAGHYLLIPVQEKRTLWIDELSPENLEQFQFSSQEREIAARLGLSSVVLVPLFSAERYLGLLSVGSLTEGRGKAPLDIALIEDLGRRCASAIENSLLYARAQSTLSLLRATFDATADGILVLDETGKAETYNERLIQMLKDLTAEEAISLVSEWASRGEHTMTECAGERFFEVDVRSRMRGNDRAGSVVCVRDVTEARQMETRLRISDRMATVGQLAAGVAHEINNPLSHVIATLDLIRQDLPKEGPKHFQCRIDSAIASAERVAGIVRDLKTFSRETSAEIGPTDLRAVIESTLPLVANRIAQRACLIRDLADVPLVRGNAGRLGQVILNLLINAVQALPESDPSKHSIRIATRISADGRVLVEVSDTGHGILPEDKKRVFDPFFTTKPIGSGTGLGLSICYNIVQSLGGQIDVESHAGKGALFRVTLLPAEEGTVSAEERKQERSEDWGALRGTVMIIDDDHMILDLLKSAFEGQHDVILAPSPNEGARMLLEPTSRVDVVLCDLMMSGMTGGEIYESVRSVRPDIAARFVFMTGGAFTDRTQEFLKSVSNPVLSKPFRLFAAREIVQRMLSS